MARSDHPDSLICYRWRLKQSALGLRREPLMTTELHATEQTIEMSFPLHLYSYHKPYS
ncbi:hypothetical protein HanPSC8_Chr08g0320081 [Helianthus annuus]|uniref:Uncharacterized protein n=1 Tax=Helianthus annuus TaxID=4232 RepID=A0A251U436_HELAN|nr:hypothetical protein HanPSC8_Chr08g0320081 [Helianthus annuus]